MTSLPLRSVAADSNVLLFTHLAEARKYLDRRDPDDVHLAALALKLDVPVWSNDRDLTELPLRVFTTAQLLAMLGI